MPANAKLRWTFESCFPNTLDTTVRYRKDNDGKDDTIVCTGDIHAMWLRDEHLRRMLAGVIRHQFKCIGLSPYGPDPDHQ